MWMKYGATMNLIALSVAGYRSMVFIGGYLHKWNHPAGPWTRRLVYRAIQINIYLLL